MFGLLYLIDMNKKIVLWLVLGAALIALVMVTWRTVIRNFLQQWEGFSSSPYWDVSHWSWGYGTRVPNSTNNKNVVPSGTITRQQAMTDLVNYINNDFQTLTPLVKTSLNKNQWAALLSFSYNLGVDDAQRLLPNLNSQNWSALGTQWNKYIYAGGQVSQDLVNRRAAEWRLFNS